MINLDFFRNKNVLITGHTGFKGSWLSHILVNAGAKVTGVSLAPESNFNLFEILNLDKKMCSIIGDITDLALITRVFDEVKPESQKDMGKIMNALMPQIKGKADMAIVNTKIRNKLNS